MLLAGMASAVSNVGREASGSFYKVKGRDWQVGCSLNQTESWKWVIMGGHSESPRMVLQLKKYMCQALGGWGWQESGCCCVLCGTWVSLNTLTLFNTCVSLNTHLLPHPICNQDKMGWIVRELGRKTQERRGSWAEAARLTRTILGSCTQFHLDWPFDGVSSSQETMELIWTTQE